MIPISQEGLNTVHATSTLSEAPVFSIVVPAYYEAGSLPKLHEEVVRGLSAIDMTYYLPGWPTFLSWTGRSWMNFLS